LICADDDAAIAAAKQLVDGHSIELWRGARKDTTLPQKQMKQSIRLFVIPMRRLGMGTAKCVKSA